VNYPNLRTTKNYNDQSQSTIRRTFDCDWWIIYFYSLIHYCYCSM